MLYCVKSGSLAGSPAMSEHSESNGGDGGYRTRVRKGALISLYMLSCLI